MHVHKDVIQFSHTHLAQMLDHSYHVTVVYSYTEASPGFEAADAGWVLLTAPAGAVA